MPPTFSSGATLDAQGQLIPVVDVQPTPDPAEVAPEAEPTQPDAAGESASDEAPAPAEPAESEEEGVVSPSQSKGPRPFVARIIRENALLKRDFAAQAAQIEYLTRQLTQAPAAPTPTQPAPVQPSPDPTKPRPELYPSHEEYIEALTDWKYDQRDRQRQQHEAQMREEQGRTLAQQQWAQREAEGRDTYEDYDEVVSRLTLAQTIAPIVADTFRESEQGAALLYYLGQHPRDMQHLNTLTPLAAARWLGQLEVRLATPPATPPRRGAPASNGTNGPPAAAPMRPVGTGGTTPVTGFRSGMPLLEYERLRAQQRQRQP